MASATFLLLLHLHPSSKSSPPLSTLHLKPKRLHSPKSIILSPKASATTLDYSSPSIQTKTSSWQWKFEGNSINIHVETVERNQEKLTNNKKKKILMVPTIADVSTVEEWRKVAEEIVVSQLDWSATIVDWPGLGFSDRPKLEYDAPVMEKFLVDFVADWGDDDYAIFGGGHGATYAVHAAANGLLKPKAIAAVAPTWAGPLPIMFGRDSNMENRYGLVRATLRAPGLGWMMYNALVSNEKIIQSKYKAHVYSDPRNVKPDMISARYELTRRKGARYAPAAFLTGLLDAVQSREEFLELFARLESTTPVLVISTSGSPKRSKANMFALKGAKGVSKFVELEGALLPQEEYPKAVAHELSKFLLESTSV